MYRTQFLNFEVFRRARPAALGEVIVNMDFPESLREGEKITGVVILRNPFPNPAVLACGVRTAWNDNVYADFSKTFEVAPGDQLNFVFPAEFRTRIPEDVPDPVMPDRDATLAIYGVALDAVTKEGRREDATFTIKLRLEWWEQSFIGIPVWTWLAVGIGTVLIGAGVFSYMREREQEMLLMTKLLRRG